MFKPFFFNWSLPEHGVIFTIKSGPAFLIPLTISPQLLE